MRWFVSFLLVAAAASAASAAELRPVANTELCLTVAPRGERRTSTVEPCDHTPLQDFRKGQLDSVISDDRCLQVVRMEGEKDLVVGATACLVRPGQRWRLARDGRLTNDLRQCLTVAGDLKAGAKVTARECKQEPADLTDEKWAVYGRF